MSFDYELANILESYIQGKIYKKGYQWLMLCPFHNDTKQSLSVHMEAPPRNKGWICFGCGLKGHRNALIARLTGKPVPSEEEREKLLFSSNKKKPLLQTTSIVKHEETAPQELFISTDKIEKYHENLLCEPKVLSVLFQKRLLNLKTINKFKLGWDGQRVIIPIWDEQGRCCNIRKYHWWHRDKIISERGYGKARLYGI